jgi:uncharacterized membrane protein YccF (DUF307 family)
MAAGWMIAAIVMAITIIGLPWTRAAFNSRLHAAALWPESGFTRRL